jgi:hypothetical protein
MRRSEEPAYSEKDYRKLIKRRAKPNWAVKRKNGISEIHYDGAWIGSYESVLAIARDEQRGVPNGRRVQRT